MTVTPDRNNVRRDLRVYARHAAPSAPLRTRYLWLHRRLILLPAPHNTSHSKTFGTRRSMPPHSITKTITTTVAELPKDSDSTIELVETPTKAVAEGGSVATMSTADQG